MTSDRGAPADAPIALTPGLAAERWGNTPRWWRTQLAELVHLGLAAKRGRTVWARPSKIEAWLCGELQADRRSLRVVRGGRGGA